MAWDRVAYAWDRPGSFGGVRSSVGRWDRG
jgi:hypothetical protein